MTHVRVNSNTNFQQLLCILFNTDYLNQFALSRTTTLNVTHCELTNIPRHGRKKHSASEMYDPQYHPL